MGKQKQFRIFVRGLVGSVEEWRRALHAPLSELPPLSSRQKETARKFGVSEEKRRRGVLLDQLAERRAVGMAKRLGTIAGEIIRTLGQKYRLDAVIANGGKWALRIETPETVEDVEVPGELAEDVLASGANGDIEKLKVCLLTALGRDELIVRR